MIDDAVVLGCWTGGPAPATGPLFFDARSGAAADWRGLFVVIGEDQYETAPAVLEAGARKVLVPAASSAAVGRLARLRRENGHERVGVWADVAPMEVRWRLEVESNADFKTLTPSMPEPCWELLASDGSRTGMRADDWLGRMFDIGAGLALVRADLADPQDRDLNICAGLVERFGDRIWFEPSEPSECSLDPWIRFGHARRFVLPGGWEVARARAEPEATRAA